MTAASAFAEADPTSLPFQEAVDYFRAKTQVPTAQWADMLHGAHTQAFTVAGATKDQVLTDLYQAVDKAISQGTTLEEFRKDFDATVAKTGWDHSGTRNWRSKVIYETNLWTAYSAGRYAQMTDPDVLRYQPYWEYVHSDLSQVPRPEHLAWNGLVLRADDQWWSSHYPPNGWGCKCSVRPITRRELAAMGKSAPDQAPPTQTSKATLKTSAGDLTIDVPKGVDPGWGYSPGEAAFGRPRSFGPAGDDAVAQAVMAGSTKGAELQSLTPTPPTVTRPTIPWDPPQAKMGTRAKSLPEATQLITQAIGAPETAYSLPTGDPVTINARALASHYGVKNLERTRFAPFLAEMIQDPYEIWMSFDRSKITGEVFLRKRIIKRLKLRQGGEMLLIAEAAEGRLSAVNYFEAANSQYLERQRTGMLLYRRI